MPLSPETRRAYADRLFIGMYPEGVVYADRKREEHGDYRQLAFQSYRTGAIEWAKGRVHPAFRELIEEDAATRPAGTVVRVDTAGHTRTIGA